MSASIDLTPVWLTAQLALVTTVLLLPLASALAWWLARTRSRARNPSCRCRHRCPSRWAARLSAARA